ncbi:MAG: hypothetical protein WCQ47_04595 [bacterium]
MDRVKTAVDIVKKNCIPLMSIALAYSVIELGIMKILSPVMGTQSITGILNSGSSMMILALLGFEFARIIFLAGFIPMILLAVNGEKLSVISFKKFITKKKVQNILLLELVIIPIFVLGLVLLVVPGVYWFVITLISYFIISEKENAGVLDSISKSISMTKGYGWLIFVYIFIYTVVSFFASMLPVISVITDTLLVPVLYVLIAIIYKECSKTND